jgi:hypothetical protein
MDRPVQRARRSWFPLGVTVVMVGVACLTPVAAVGTWVLLTDAEVAAEVAGSGDLWPLAAAIARGLGQALIRLVSYL